MVKHVVNILGTEYTVFLGGAEDMPQLVKMENQGLTLFYEKKIYILTENMDKECSMTDKALTQMIRETIIHELHHAYLLESGSTILGDDQERVCQTFEVLHDKINDTLINILDASHYNK